MCPLSNNRRTNIFSSPRRGLAAVLIVVTADAFSIGSSSTTALTNLGSGSVVSDIMISRIARVRRSNNCESFLCSTRIPSQQTGARLGGVAVTNHWRRRLLSRTHGTEYDSSQSRLFSVLPFFAQEPAIASAAPSPSISTIETISPETTTTTLESPPLSEDANNKQSEITPPPAIKPHPLAWTKNFGSRSPANQTHYESIAHLRPGDEGYFDVSSMTVKGTTIIRTPEQARIALAALWASPPSTFHACDTEVMDINLKEEGPVGNGFVTCLSIYSGPDFDYGMPNSKGTALWVDNMDDSFGLMQMFKDWMESEDHLKVWHNYGFDRHVMWNEGIDCLGFGGDTMHMARLQDTNRKFRGGYSLEALSGDLLKKRKMPMKEIFGVKRLRKDGSEGTLVDIPAVEVLQRDPAFRSKWIMYSAYDAQSTWELRAKLEEQLKKIEWMNESAPGATRSTNMYDYYTMHMREFGVVLTDMERRGIRVDARDYLHGVEIQARKDRAYHLHKFREWACGILGEANGQSINPASSLQLGTFFFGGSMNPKTRERTEAVRVFKVPKEEVSEEALQAFTDKDKQQQTTVEKEVDPTQDMGDLEKMTAVQLKSICREFKLKLSGKKGDLQERVRDHFLNGSAKNGDDTTGGDNVDDYENMSLADLKDACVVRGLPTSGTKKKLQTLIRADVAFSSDLIAHVNPTDHDGYNTVSEALESLASKSSSAVIREIMDNLRAKDDPANKKYVEVRVESVGMTPEKFTAGGSPSCTADVLRSLAGDPLSDPPKYGTAYNFFGGGKPGHEACVALYSLTAIGSIDTMIANFLTSLQSTVDDQSRVHCSLNINTETGRLSSRRPNLQNQPALEKDTYKIRQAFKSCPGNNLIVADYGQLELRLLASMTDCVSMTDAFRLGGDFHSRTAMGMFPHIQKRVDDGEILFEWDYTKGEQPDKPLVKDEYAAERRKAKTLNFSIAYGKTAHGLSQDWGVSIKEAEAMLKAWYDSRPEVLRWQQQVKEAARKHGVTRTLMGRYRNIPDAMSNNRRLVGSAERAAINTPIQGGAADIAMMAMNLINKSEILKRLGWILLMQIHDEVILEGPEESAEEAFDEVILCMEEPWVFGLNKTSVPLVVDGSFKHKNWYDAK